MLLITDLNDIPPLDKPCALTIGSFDGVHLGHQALLKHLKGKGTLCVFTFSNHPSTLFNPDNPVDLICPPLQKVKLLHDYGVDLVILIPFTRSFANVDFDEFLRQLKSKLNFSWLALGVGAAFGKNRKGDEAAVRRLASQLDFNVDYLPKTIVKGLPVSSGRIRSCIAQGRFQDAQELLGRHYSLLGRLKDNGFHLPTLSLPPDGVYPVRVLTEAEEYPGRALISNREKSLQLDLQNSKLSLQDKDVEVIF